METTRPKPFCFVLMPFSDTFDDIYKLGIKECCSKNGAYCERVDEQVYDGTILQRIYNQISKADIIIADMTGRNPNVFYEVGYAHALGKPTILLTQTKNDIPFDLLSYPHIIYNSSIVSLKKELYKKIKWFVNNPAVLTMDVKNGIKLFWNGNDLSTPDISYTQNNPSTDEIQINVFNSSSRTYLTDSFSLGCIAKYCPGVVKLEGQNALSTQLPEGEKMYYMPPSKGMFFPGMSYSFKLAFVIRQQGKQDRLSLVFRLFSDTGNYDYFLTIDKMRYKGNNVAVF